MIAWLHPAALLTLAAVAVPLLVHLLLRQRAARIPVPSVRFIPASRASALRLRSPSDLPLLLLRILIVACAAIAVARPLLVTDGRRHAWQGRRAVAIVVAASPSAPMEEAVRAQQADAHATTVIGTSAIGPGLDRAAAWLMESPPATREIVVLSDFRQGVLSGADVARVPLGAGIRFVRVPLVAAPRRDHRDTVLTVDGTRALITRVDGEQTQVELPAAVEAPSPGLRLVTAPGEEDEAAALMRVVSHAGTFAPSAARPVAIRFRDAPDAGVVTAEADGWMFGAAARLLEWSGRTGIGIEVGAAGDELVIDAGVPPASLQAAEVLRAVLQARWDADALRELETERIPDAALQAWTRVPAPPGPDDWRRSDDSDGRWLWGLALGLLIAEGRLRRARVARSPTETAHAA